MELFGNIVLFLSIAWVLLYFFDLRGRGRRGGGIMPPVLSAHLLFALCIIVVALFQFSPLHLLWLFPLSFIVGFLILMSPLVQALLLRFVLAFAPPTQEGMREAEEMERELERLRKEGRMEERRRRREVNKKGSKKGRKRRKGN